MPNRVAVHNIKLGGGVKVKPGEIYNFTDDEIATLAPLGAIRTVPEEKAARIAAARAQPDEPSLQQAARAAGNLEEGEGDEGERAPRDGDDDDNGEDNGEAAGDPAPEKEADGSKKKGKRGKRGKTRDDNDDL